MLQVDDSTNPLQFTQLFHLIPDGGSFYVYVSRGVNGISAT